MNKDEAKYVCQDLSKWRSNILPTPPGNKRDAIYVCVFKYYTTNHHDLLLDRLKTVLSTINLCVS